MEHDNKRNIHYFIGSSMNELYERLDGWQRENQKRFLSLSIQNDGGGFCCIALTNPSEMVIVDSSGHHQAYVHPNGDLAVRS